MNDSFRLALEKHQQGLLDQAAQLDLKVLSRELSTTTPTRSPAAAVGLPGRPPGPPVPACQACGRAAIRASPYLLRSDDTEAPTGGVGSWRGLRL